MNRSSSNVAQLSPATTASAPDGIHGAILLDPTLSDQDVYDTVRDRLVRECRRAGWETPRTFSFERGPLVDGMQQITFEAQQD